MNHLRVFCFIVTTMYFGLNEAVYCKYNYVIIRNELGAGRVLEYHCRSNDHDLGIKHLKFDGTPYQIEFMDSSGIPKTKWDCDLRQGMYFYNITVYKAGSLPRCGQLREWSARLDGIYTRRSKEKPLGWALPWKKL